MNQSLFFATALLATGLYVVSIALFLGLHLLHSPYSALRHAVSDYGVGPTARLFQVYVWAGNAGALALIALFSFAQQPHFPALIALFMLVMLGSRMGVARFKTDVEGSPRTRAGSIHYLFAILTFAFAYTTIANATPMLVAATPPPLASLLSMLHAVALAALIGVVVTVFAPLRRFFAVVERVFLLTTMLWFLAASYAFVWFAAV